MSAAAINPPPLEEHEAIFTLPDGRTHHYASTGDPQSRLVILFFPGILAVASVNDAATSSVFREYNAHYIAITLPGNGLSSTRPANIPYHSNLCSTITLLLEDLHPSDDSKGNAVENLYIAGGSYGTVPAQMLYGAPFSLFPYGAKVRGCLLLAPFSPFKYHTAYTRDMTWSNYLAVGPPAQCIPCRIVPRLISTAIAWTCKDVHSVVKLLDKALFNLMDDEETAKLETYTHSRGTTVQDFKEHMARSSLRCMRNWDGYIEVADILHSDWGFDPSSLHAEHANHARKVYIVQGSRDPLGPGMARWLSRNYASAELKIVSGGHLASLFCLEEIWDTVIGTPDGSVGE